MQRRSRILLFLLLSIAACAGPGRKAADVRGFPKVSVPEAYTSHEDRLTYACAHYWDDFFACSGPTDSARVLGVARPEVEQAFSNYIVLLGLESLDEAQKNMSGLFKDVCSVQMRDTAGQFYTQFTQLVSSYLYDPNSPVRDEDLYLPFVQALATSPLTREDLRTAYRYEASMCALNPRGSVAPDFSARRPNGTVFNLHGIKAPYTLLLFTNPGCHACKEIVDLINSELGAMVASGTLAVANIYIDEDFAAWKAYAGNYPAEWYTGFDFRNVIRGSVLYDVRAIPSIYLLDFQKRILARDAPFPKVVALLSAR